MKVVPNSQLAYAATPTALKALGGWLERGGTLEFVQQIIFRETLVEEVPR